VTTSSPKSIQGQPAAIVSATTQTPRAIIPAEIRNESTVSMIGPLSSRVKVGPPAEGERPAAPAAQNRAANGGLRRPTGRDLRPTNAAGRSCGLRGALKEFNARLLHAGAVTRSGTAGGGSKPTAPVAQSRTPMGDAGGLPTRLELTNATSWSCGVCGFI
jgi:hypothetical protein